MANPLGISFTDRYGSQCGAIQPTEEGPTPNIEFRIMTTEDSTLPVLASLTLVPLVGSSSLQHAMSTDKFTCTLSHPNTKAMQRQDGIDSARSHLKHTWRRGLFRGTGRMLTMSHLFFTAMLLFKCKPTGIFGVYIYT